MELFDPHNSKQKLTSSSQEFLHSSHHFSHQIRFKHSAPDPYSNPDQTKHLYGRHSRQQARSVTSLPQSQQIPVVIPILDPKLLKQKNTQFTLSCQKDLNIQKLLRQSLQIASSTNLNSQPPQILIQRPSTTYKRNTQQRRPVTQELQRNKCMNGAQTSSSYASYQIPYPRLKQAHSTAQQFSRANVYGNNRKSLPQQSVTDPDLCLEMNANQIQIKSLFQHYERQFTKHFPQQTQAQTEQSLSDFENELISQHASQACATNPNKVHHLRIPVVDSANGVQSTISMSNAAPKYAGMKTVGPQTLALHSMLHSIQHHQAIQQQLHQPILSVQGQDNSDTAVTVQLRTHHQAPDNSQYIRPKSQRRPQTVASLQQSQATFGHQKLHLKRGSRVDASLIRSRQAGSLSPGSGCGRQRNQTSPGRPKLHCTAGGVTSSLQKNAPSSIIVLNKDIDHISTEFNQNIQQPTTETYTKDDAFGMPQRQETEELSMQLTSRMRGADQQLCRQLSVGQGSQHGASCEGLSEHRDSIQIVKNGVNGKLKQKFKKGK